MVDPQEAHRVLTASPLLRGVRSSDIRHLIQTGDIRTWPHGELVLRADVTALEFFVVLSGTVRVVIDGNTVRTLGPGDYFGEIGLRGRAERTATVIADGTTQAFAISRTHFDALLEANPQVAAHIDAVMQDRATSDTDPSQS